MDYVLSKFIPFSKVDSIRREVSGIVTAERPDKEFEVCDYAESKPYYQAWSDGFAKTTDGKSFGNLRIMHQLQVAGKAIEPIRYNDEEKQIEMTFKVVDDDAWKKVEERVFTGFSQGGKKVGEMRPDPVFKRCMRYVANPAEISLVDNPCLPDARFAYVKSDGAGGFFVEMRKFLKIEEPVDPRETTERLTVVEQELSLLKAAAAPPHPADHPPAGNAPAPPHTSGSKPPAPGGDVEKGKTKRVAGKDLSPSDFAYVGDPEKTETWKFPVHDKSHAQNALARWGQAKGIPASAKAKVRAKIVAAARRFGVEVSDEKVAAFQATIRKVARVYVNQNFGRIASKSLLNLDSDLGKLRKGMFEVSRLACHIEEIACLLNAVTCEQNYELDEESQLPEMLRENIADLVDTLLEMVDEESQELLEQIGADDAEGQPAAAG
jgi:hypothetical protein